MFVVFLDKGRQQIEIVITIGILVKITYSYLKTKTTIAPKLLYGRKECDLATLLTPLVIHTLLYSRKWPRSPRKTFKNPPVSSWRCDSVATSTNLKTLLQSFPQFY